MAGATITGFKIDHYPVASFFLYGHALNTFVIRLSHIPFVIFAKVFALNGAINNSEANFCNSI